MAAPAPFDHDDMPTDTKADIAKAASIGLDDSQECRAAASRRALPVASFSTRGPWHLGCEGSDRRLGHERYGVRPDHDMYIPPAYLRPFDGPSCNIIDM